MAMTPFQPWRKQGDDVEERKKKSTFSNLLPWPLVLMAAVPVALAVYYLTMVGPEYAARGLSAADVPLPAATKFLANVCDWCGKNRFKVVLMGVALLMGGLLSSLLAARYYIALTVLVSLGLGFTYYSVSAPVDRMIKGVKESIPRDRRVPSSR